MFPILSFYVPKFECLCPQVSSEEIWKVAMRPDLSKVTDFQPRKMNNSHDD
jgi:hypothetical protein